MLANIWIRAVGENCGIEAVLRKLDTCFAKPDGVAFYSALGFKTIELVRGALGDRPEPVAMFLPIQQIELAVGEVDGAAE
ncbi:MAG: hypothetical protein ABFS45_17575 [Pseudomonadota bacterium]